MVLVVVALLVRVRLLIGRIGRVMVPVGMAVGVVVVVVRKSDGCCGRRHLAGYEPSGRGEGRLLSRSIGSLAIVSDSEVKKSQEQRERRFEMVES
jgi:hypothetical protein